MNDVYVTFQPYLYRLLTFVKLEDAYFIFTIIVLNDII